MKPVTRRLRHIIDPIVNPGREPLVFLLGGVSLALMGNALYELFKGWLGSAAVVLALAFGLIGVLLTGLYLPNALRRRRQQRLSLGDIQPRLGLIVLVSQGSLDATPAMAAISFHLPRLKYCWLVTTIKPVAEPEAAMSAGAQVPPHSAWANANALRERFVGAPHRCDMMILPPVPHDNPEKIYEVIEQAYASARALRLPAHEVVADLTGGTKMMSVAMALACLPQDRDVQFLAPKALLADGRADPAMGATPKLIDLGFGAEMADG